MRPTQTEAQVQADRLELALEFAEDCPWFHLRKVTRAFTQIFDEVIGLSGLRATQLSILVAVAVAKSPTITHLAEELVMDRTTLTRNLRPLERQGFIEIVRSQEDRRVRQVLLTEAGVKAMARALQTWKMAKDFAVEKMGEMKVHGLHETLSEMLTMVHSELKQGSMDELRQYLKNMLAKLDG